jgi:hypothetical protein
MGARIAVAFFFAACALVSVAQAQLGLREQASGFTYPLAFVHDPNDRAVQFVVQQDGHIRVPRCDGSQRFVDLSSALISGGEQDCPGPRSSAVGSRPPPDGSSSISRTDRRHRRRPAAVERRRSPIRRRGLIWAGKLALAFIAQPYANHNGGNSVWPRRIYGLGWRSGGDPENRAQNGRSFSEDAAHRRQRRGHSSIGVSGAGGQSLRPRGAVLAARDLGVRLAQPGTARRSARGGTGALVIATSDRIS